MPKRMVAAIGRGSAAVPKACGRMSRNTAASSAPTAKLISTGICEARALRAKIAAMNTLRSPPITLAVMIQSKTDMRGFQSKEPNYK